MLHVKGCLDSDEAAILLEALETIAGKLDELATEDATAGPDDRAGPDDHKASPRGRVDALAGLARSFLNRDGDVERDPDAQLVVYLDAQALERNARAGLAAYRSGGRLTSEQARRLACDSAFVLVLKDGSEVLDVGRSTRTVSKALRRALIARDGGCAMPGCAEHRLRKLHAHHVWHWSDGGPTCLDNLVLLCKAHHYAIHHNGFTVTAAHGRFVFRTPDGVVLDPTPALPVTTKPLPATDHEAVPRWTGEHLDLDYVLTTLMQRRAHREQQRRISEQHLNPQREPLAA
jgi:hypothetical protein